MSEKQKPRIWLARTLEQAIVMIEGDTQDIAAGHAPVVVSGRSMYIAVEVSSTRYGNFAAICEHSTGEVEKKCESPYAGGNVEPAYGAAFGAASG